LSSLPGKNIFDLNGFRFHQLLRETLVKDLCKIQYSLIVFFVSLIFTADLHCANWTLPVDVSLSGSNSSGVQVFMDSGKRTVAVWSGFDGSNYVIYAATKDPSGAWSVPSAVSMPGEDAFFPQVAIDAGGNAAAVWSRSNGTNFVIQAATKRLKKAWSVPVDLSSAGKAGQDATAPQIVLDQKGFANVVWHRNNGNLDIIEFSAQNSSGLWSSPTKLSGRGKEGLGDTQPQIAIDQSGNLMAVWCNAANSVVQWVEKPVGGLWSLPVAISEVSNTVANAHIALDPLGNASTIWSRSDGNNMVIQSASKPLSGQWSAPINLSVSGEDAIAPSLAVSTDGNAVAAWQRFDGKSWIIQAAMKSSNGVWAAANNLTDAGQDASNPQVAMGAAKIAVIVWKRNDGSNFLVQSSKTTLGQKWSLPYTISLSGEDSADPQISMNSLGQAVTVWEKSDGINSSVQASYKAFLE
jgi:hypothetical protein